MQETTAAPPPPPPPKKKKQIYNIWAKRPKPLDFRASAGENIWARDLSPPLPRTKLIPYAYDIGVRGREVRGMQSPLELKWQNFRAKNKVIFRQNHLIFGQVLEDVFRQETSGPPPPPTPRTDLAPYAYGSTVF